MAARGIRRPIPTELGQQLRYARIALALTQRDLAERLGCAQYSVSSLENGKKDTLLSTLIDHAAALGLELVLVAIAPREDTRDQH